MIGYMRDAIQKYKRAAGAAAIIGIIYAAEPCHAQEHYPDCGTQRAASDIVDYEGFGSKRIGKEMEIAHYRISDIIGHIEKCRGQIPSAKYSKDYCSTLEDITAHAEKTPTIGYQALAEEIRTCERKKAGHKAIYEKPVIESKDHARPKGSNVINAGDYDIVF